MINIKDLKDVKLKSSMIERAEELKLLSMESEKKILKDVIKTINN
jgi:formiminotetrahydrofolate cyclodeaminase